MIFLASTAFTTPSSSLTGKIKSIFKLNLLILLLLFLLSYQLHRSYGVKFTDLRVGFQQIIGFYKDNIWGSRGGQDPAPTLSKLSRNTATQPPRPIAHTPPATKETQRYTTKETSKDNDNNKERFSIQLHSFRDTFRAYQEIEELKRKGYDAYIFPVDLADKGKWSRIMVGRFNDLNAAQKTAEELRKREGISAIRIVTTHPSIPREQTR